MRQTATRSARARQRAGRSALGWVCGAFVALQLIVVTVLPPQVRGVVAGLLTMLTVVGVLVVAMEASFKRAGMRAAESSARLAEAPRRPRERVSPLIQRAYYLARHNVPASHIAGSCQIPEAFAVLIVDDVRRSGLKSEF